MPIDPGSLEAFTAKLNKALAEVKKWKLHINGLYEAHDEPPPFTDLEDDTALANVRTHVRPYARNEFYNLGLTDAVKRILEDHGAQNEDELYDKLFAGGFKFGELNPIKAKTNLKISLGKLAAFGKTPAGDYVIETNPARRNKVKKSQDLPEGTDSVGPPLDADDENPPESASAGGLG